MKKTIATYEIIEEIQQGATTVVYKAFQPSLDRIILLKVLHKNLAGEKDIVARFQREARACARIKHENIVDVFDYGFDQGHHYIAMEFVDGISIDQLLKKADSIPLEIISYIIIEILKGLAFAHANGVFHRDIKPGNILLSFQGKVKITDFGLALISDSKSVTMQNTILGTPAYMSPEQITGEKLDGRTDIFSLGATFYEMLTNNQAFAGSTFSERVNKILNKEPPKLENLRSGIPPQLVAIIKKMLSKKPARRFKTSELVLNELFNLGRENNITLTRSQFAAYIKSPENYSPDQIKPKTIDIKFKALKWIAWTSGFVLLFTAVVLSINYFQTTPKVPLEYSKPGSDSLEIKIQQPGKTEAKKDSLPLQIYPSEKFESSPGEDVDRKVEKMEVMTPAKTSNPLPKAAIRTGKLVIRCAPWAKVFINGDYQKTLFESDSLRIEKKPGLYKITLINSDFAPYDTVNQAIRIASSEIKRLKIPFIEAARVGFLKVLVKPWAKVYIDGIYKGTTPFKPVIIKQGNHVLTLKNPQAEEWKKDVIIKTGETLEVAVNLMERP